MKKAIAGRVDDTEQSHKISSETTETAGGASCRSTSYETSDGKRFLHVEFSGNGRRRESIVPLAWGVAVKLDKIPAKTAKSAE